MIYIRVVLLFSLVVFYSNSYCQIDSQKLDSLSRAIDSSAKGHRKWQDSFNRIQDSLYESSVNNVKVAQPGDYKKTEEKRRQRAVVRLIIGVLFCIGLIIGFKLRKRPRS